MRRGISLAAGLAGIVAGVIGFPCTARATTITESVKGTIAYGTDNTGPFGTVGADLTGQSFSASFIYDTSLINLNGYLSTFS